MDETALFGRIDAQLRALHLPGALANYRELLVRISANPNRARLRSSTG